MSDHAPGNSMAARIRFRRRAAGLTLDGLAAAAGISKTYLWELEADEGGSKRPSADVLLRIATALDTTLQDLMGLSGQPSMDDLLPIHLARARLIEAAPDLLAACREAMYRLSKIDLTYLLVFEQLEDDIAKTEGHETPAYDPRGGLPEVNG